jgi:hypothetical protein
MKISSATKRYLKSGFNLMEISLIIALLLGLTAVAVVGIGSYVIGANKAKCNLPLFRKQYVERLTWKT